MQRPTWKAWKEILKLAWPLILANSFWNLQMTIDRIFLGQYSTEALGAAMAVFGIFWTPMALLQQTASYILTFVAQLWGAKRQSEIGACFWQALYIALLGGLLFLLLMFPAAYFFRFVGHSPSLQNLESVYFETMCWSALPMALVAAASGFFTGLGRSTVVLWINGAGLLSNALLDYLLILGKGGFPALGIAGAGYATALASWVSAAVGLCWIFQKDYRSKFFPPGAWKWDFPLMKRFLRFGLPSGLQWALEGLAFTVFLILVGRMAKGEAALAASGIAVTVMMLAILPALGLAQAVSVLVGQHLGENRPKSAQQSSWTGLQIAWLYIAVVAATFWLFPHFYLEWFYNPEKAELWQQVATYVPYLLMFVGTFILFDSMNLIFSFTLKGAGDTRFVSLVALLLPWPLMVLPTWLVQHHSHALYWAWAAASVYIITQALIFWRRFEGGRWKLMRVIDN
ncbi:MAG: MATE family efflux transporter [Deltaproteobacteria bacterium]|nr:MATE family efflux transporter [Deltaproteobacteria bacterium]